MLVCMWPPYGIQNGRLLFVLHITVMWSIGIMPVPKSHNFDTIGSIYTTLLIVAVFFWSPFWILKWPPLPSFLIVYIVRADMNMNMDIQDTMDFIYTTKMIIDRFVLLAFFDFKMATILVIFCIADLLVMCCAWLLLRNV